MHAADPHPVALQRRVDDAIRALAFLALTAPLGAVTVLAVLLVPLAAALSVLWIGLPMLVALPTVAERLARLDRRLANRLLEAHIEPLPPLRRRTGTWWRRGVATISDRRMWRTFALPAARLPVSTGLLLVGAAPVALTAWLLVHGAQGLSGPATPRYFGAWELGPATGLLMWALALPSALLSIAVLGAVGWVSRALTRALARRPPSEGPIREMLAESLGDRTLSIAYWLPDRHVFVDESGRPVELPAPGSGRAWTAVERDGQRVAAIVHDAELDASQELVQAAAAAAALALDNERLKADLRARVEELRVSRVRIVEAADNARRRIERDLHDGAQQRLVALALDLRVLKARVRDKPEAAAAVDDLSEKLQTALAELRDLARGIHPAILTDRGLGPAIEALAARSPMPVETHVDVDGRLSAAIEAAAYFTVAEGLTNVAKYGHATHASVTVERLGDEVLVAVDDDGVGGADVRHGTGLRGLEDRLAALDGTLFVDSPPGRGTHLRARIPCTARDLIEEAHESEQEPALEGQA